ncbi:MAG: Ig-like domain-containing protein [Spirochaetales bacterium]
MSRLQPLPPVVAALVLVVSCDLVDLHRLEVQTTPASAHEVVGADSAIRATFSRPVNEETVERAFLLETATEEIEVDFDWSQEGFRATPVETPKPGVPYRLQLDGSIVDERGLDHDVDIYVPFFFGNDSPRPNLQRSTPSAGGDIGVFDPVRLVFSIPVDRGRFEDTIAVTPDTEFDVSWHSKDTVVEITPSRQWEPLTVYRWSISNDTVSKDGVPIASAASGSFFTQYDATSPNLTEYRFARIDEGIAVETDALQADGVVLLEFSEAVRFESVRRALTVAPGVRSAVEQKTDREFLVRFDEELRGGQLYEISISDELRDLSGNRPTGDQSFTVEPVSNRQLVSRIRSFWATASGDGVVNLELDAGASGSTEAGLGSPDGTNTLQFEFDIPYESKAARDRLIEAVELRALLPDRAVNPDVEQVRWLDGGARLRMSFAGLIPSDSVEQPSIYRLRLAAGSSSAPDRASGLERSLIVYIRTEVE